MKESRDVQAKIISYDRDQQVELSLSQTTLEIIDYALWGVVNEGGTAGGVGFPRELNIGGKTGTAQVIAREKVRSKLHKDHSWFISFAPMHTGQKPEIGVVCITENGGWGASASAPKVKMIQAAYFSKKLGRPILPEMVAFNLDGVAKPEAPPQTSPAPPDRDRPKPPVRR
jgi:cell division protein FtsI/penicillin-binding protein 2